MSVHVRSVQVPTTRGEYTAWVDDVVPGRYAVELADRSFSAVASTLDRALELLAALLEEHAPR